LGHGSITFLSRHLTPKGFAVQPETASLLTASVNDTAVTFSGEAKPRPKPHHHSQCCPCLRNKWFRRFVGDDFLFRSVGPLPRVGSRPTLERWPLQTISKDRFHYSFMRKPEEESIMPGVETSSGLALRNSYRLRSSVLLTSVADPGTPSAKHTVQRSAATGQAW